MELARREDFRRPEPDDEVSPKTLRRILVFYLKKFSQTAGFSLFGGPAVAGGDGRAVKGVPSRLVRICRLTFRSEKAPG